MYGIAILSCYYKYFFNTWGIVTYSEVIWKIQGGIVKYELGGCVRGNTFVKYFVVREKYCNSIEEFWSYLAPGLIGARTQDKNVGDCL